MNSNNNRVDIVDIMRGFAIVSIMLLHNIEHFDFHYTAEFIPSWLVPIDKGIWDTLMFLFSGKSYAIFALLFGFTFFIQTENQKRKGKDFSLRFAWRMFLLLCFGLVNSAFYLGDILTIYAALGFFLIPFSRLSNRVLLIIAIICLLQPYEFFKIIQALIDPGLEVVKTSYFKGTKEYLSNGSFWDVIQGNLTIGKKGVVLWSWDKGRFFQTFALFLLGVLAGRYMVFSKKNIKLWVNTMVIAAIVFGCLFVIQNNTGRWINYKALSRPIVTILKSWSNFSFMLVWVSVFNLLSYNISIKKIISYFTPFGRMSLSNYVIQSIAGSFIYYGFGLGLYKYTGSSYCLLIGLVLTVLQGMFCRWWLTNHARGPLEMVWHKFTWIR